MVFFNYNTTHSMPIDAMPYNKCLLNISSSWIVTRAFHIISHSQKYGCGVISYSDRKYSTLKCTVQRIGSKVCESLYFCFGLSLSFSAMYIYICVWMRVYVCVFLSFINIYHKIKEMLIGGSIISVGVATAIHISSI